MHVDDLVLFLSQKVLIVDHSSVGIGESCDSVAPHEAVEFCLQKIESFVELVLLVG